MQNLVSPLRSQIRVVALQRVTMVQRVEDMEKSEWQLVIGCIKEQIYLIRKDADFPLVFHCMNRDKPMNMRKSITLNGEILIDTKCYWAVSWNYKGRIKNCRPILKGYGMLEPYEAKVSCTVLRRGGASNRSLLFDIFNISMIINHIKLNRWFFGNLYNFFLTICLNFK